MTAGSFWDAVVSDDEVDHDDERVNRALRWRELERHLDGVRRCSTSAAALVHSRSHSPSAASR